MWSDRLLWAAAALEAAGEAPYYWMSLHVPGGQEYDDAVMPHFQARGW